jgi:uncharacterized protein YndB with AHSA1/START domain
MAMVISYAQFLARRRARLAARQGRPQGADFQQRFWEESLDRLSAYAPSLAKETTMNELEIIVPADEPIILSLRLFDAPRRLVWECCTEARHMARWWCPKGYVNTVTEMDVRVGGRWRVESLATRGSLHIFAGRYLEVVEPEKLVMTFGVEGMFGGREMVETLTFEEHGDKTLYRSSSRFAAIADRDAMVASGMEKGARESMESLDQLLDELKVQ